jgi:flagellar biosynthesis/type III secretory pathway M-ring protein FliF/YscJ
MFVIKPLLAALTAPLPRPAGSPAGVSAPEAAPVLTPEEMTRERALGIVNSNPQQAANVVKEWLQE